MPDQLLVDTHVLLWMLTDPTRLADPVRTLLGDPRCRIFVSAASAWEIATKSRLGKLPQADVLLQAYGRHLQRLGVHSLAITSEHAVLAGSLNWSHRDPFDRVIAAQCLIESLALVTVDPAFEGMAGLRLLR